MKARHSSDAVPLAFKKFVAFGFLVALSGCVGNKLESDQIALMPAPAIYGDGRIDPFIDGDPVSRGVDPGILYASPERIREEVARVLESYGHGEGHVFNLGHGITPDIDPDNVSVLVEAVHELSPNYHD